MAAVLMLRPASGDFQREYALQGSSLAAQRGIDPEVRQIRYRSKFLRDGRDNHKMWAISAGFAAGAQIG